MLFNTNQSKSLRGLARLIGLAGLAGFAGFAEFAEFAGFAGRCWVCLPGLAFEAYLQAFQKIKMQSFKINEFIKLNLVGRAPNSDSKVVGLSGRSFRGYGFNVLRRYEVNNYDSRGKGKFKVENKYQLPG